MRSSNKLTNDILEVLNNNENIISSSIVGSIIEKDIEDIADIDIVVILDQVTLKKISQIKNDLLNLSPLDYRIKKNFLINDTFGPLKFNDKKTLDINLEDIYCKKSLNINFEKTNLIIQRDKIMEIDYENLIGQWHKDRNLIDGSTDKDQYMKLIQEAGELSDSLCKGKDISDDIGDMLVVLINIMVRNNLTINECLSVAYNDIKDRKGKMIDGVFVKEGDE